jgi:NAD+ kinase
VTPSRIAIVVHPRRDVRRAVAALLDWGRSRGVEVVQLRLHGDEPAVAPEGGADGAGLIVAVGGDGTVLGALRLAAPSELPVLGVACGSLGALATVSAGDVQAALDRFASGEWIRHRIPGLDVDAGEGRAATAINDLVVVRAGGGQVAVGVEIDGVLYGRFAGDGVIASTQLGSSAYAMAAGGPVLAPDSGSWLVTPLAPHGGCIPPVVVGAGSTVRLTVDGGYSGARVEVDGQRTGMAAPAFELSLRGDYATLVRVGDEESFITGLRRRRILMDSPRVLARDARNLPPGDY